MLCDDVRPLLAERSIGELAPYQEREVERHLAQCEGCRLEAERQDLEAARMKRLFVTEKPSGLEARMLAGIQKRRSEARRFTGSERAILVAGGLVLVLVAVLGAGEWRSLTGALTLPDLRLDLPGVVPDGRWLPEAAPWFGALTALLVVLQVGGVVALLLGRRRAA